MIQFDYPSGGISRKERKKYTFSGFRGVDTSVAKINVDPSRAVESTNFVDRDGVLHKRFGWEQVYQFEGEINGFWKLPLDGSVYTICYAGTTFYQLKESGWVELYTSERLVSRRTTCYTQGKKAYFVGCGDFLVFKKVYEISPVKTIDGYAMRRVEDDNETYIPTTTAQISSRASIEDGVSGQYVRDSVNLLTGWRKNTLVSEIIPENGVVEYQLDARPSFYPPQDNKLGVSVRLKGKTYNAYPSAGEPLENDIPSDLNLIDGVLFFSPWDNSAFDERDVNFYDAFDSGKTAAEPLIKFNTGAMVCWVREEIPSSDYAVYSLWLYDDNGKRISTHLRRCFALKGETEFVGEPWGDVTVNANINSNGTLSITINARTKPYDRSYSVSVSFSNGIIKKYTLVLAKNQHMVQATQLLTTDVGSATISSLEITKTVAEFSRVEEEEVKAFYGDAYTVPEVEYRAGTDFNTPRGCAFIHTLTKAESVCVSEYKAGYNDIVQIYPNPCFQSVFYEDKTSFTITAGGKISFSCWGVSEQSKTADAEVIFYVDNNKASLVTKGQYSTLYGVDGATDRLFVANNGEREYSNLIVFSALEDFTYFPDNFTKTVGGTVNVIKGFLRLANGSMAALKTFIPGEPTVFVFNGDYINGYYDANNTEPYTLPRFTTIGVSVTQGAISAYAMSNLADDSLFLSQNGVYALELSKGTDSQRFAKERSLPINTLLKECSIDELSNAVAITHKNKYYLAVKHYKKTLDEHVIIGKNYYEKKNGSYLLAENPDENRGMQQYYEQEDCVYVADAHYTFLPMGAMADALSYEWYPLENIPVYNWFIIDDDLYFGTEDGRICKFENGRYSDVSKQYFATNISDKTAKVYSQSLVKAISFNIDIDGDGRIDTFTIDENADVVDGDTLIFLSGIITGELYGETENFLNAELTIQRLYIDDEFKGIQLKYEKSGAVLQFDKAQSLVAEIRRKKVVKASRVMPTFDFGMPDYLKTLESFTIVMNGVEGGELSMFLTTRATAKDVERVSGQTAFNMLDGFDTKSFNVPFQNAYSKAVVLRNFNYFSVKILNTTETDCSVSSISFIYKYNTRGRGVM